MQVQNKHLNTLLCQLKPILKQKTKNIQRVKKSLQHYSNKNNIDIIMFPQLSFTGYNFKNQQDALPLAIIPGQGQQFQFAKVQAIRLNTYVIFGYIQKQLNQQKISIYNSVGIINRKGQFELNVRKTQLFYNDKLWCQEGNGFKSIIIQNLKGQKFKCIIGICMDINPKDFTSGQYQLANFAIKQKAQVILFLANWVDSQADSVQDSAVQAMYNYWLHRLSPLLTHKNKPIKPPLIFLAVDRVGTQYSYFDQKNIHFFGSSCGMMLNPTYLISKLEKKNEGYLLIEGKLPK